MISRLFGNVFCIISRGATNLDLMCHHATCFECVEACLLRAIADSEYLQTYLY